RGGGVAARLARVLAPLVQRLHDLGGIECYNVVIEYLWARQEVRALHRGCCREDETMQQRRLTIAVLGGAAFLALSTAAGSQVIVSGNDEKVLWDDVGQAVFSAPGKDTISFIDIGDRENPKILTSIALENSIFGPPTNVAISPNGEIAVVANSVKQTKDG